MSKFLAKSQNNYPFQTVSQTLQMLYAGQDASLVSPVLPLEQFEGEKCCTLVLLRKIILENRALYMFLKNQFSFI